MADYLTKKDFDESMEKFAVMFKDALEDTETRLRNEIKYTETRLRNEIEETENCLRGEFITGNEKIITELKLINKGRTNFQCCGARPLGSKNRRL